MTAEDLDQALRAILGRHQLTATVTAEIPKQAPGPALFALDNLRDRDAPAQAIPHTRLRACVAALETAFQDHGLVPTPTAHTLPPQDPIPPGSLVGLAFLLTEPLDLSHK